MYVGKRLDPIETAAYWYLRYYGTMARTEPRSAREMNAKRSATALAIGPVSSYYWGERQTTAREAIRHARAIYREDKDHDRKVAKDLAFKTQCTRMVGRERADELPPNMLVGRQCIPCDRGEHVGGKWAYSHLEHLTCKILAVTGDKPERQYTIEVQEHPTIRGCGMSWRKNSLRGLVCKLPAVSLIEHVTDRRVNTTARKAIDTAKRYHIAWSLIGGAVVIPGTQKTYAYRMRLRDVGCRWDKAQRAWVA